MKKLTSADSLVTIHHYRNVLESEGIHCTLKNQHLLGAIGELPFLECWPEIWVDDFQEERAKAIVAAEIAKQAAPAASWRCPACGEEIAGQFSDCWNCAPNP